MSQNIGTLITSAIRPNNSLDPIATAYASEIRGGLHTVLDNSTRDNIIFERREWGMMCYVTSLSQTYQLSYNYSSTNIMDNSNWVLFTGSGASGNWLNPVISIQNSEPMTPLGGDRYIVGNSLTGGVQWTSLPSDMVVEWDSVIAQWIQTTPTNEANVRVLNEDNAIYNYEGVFPSGQWYKEKLGQIRDVVVSSINGQDYTGVSNPPFDNYSSDMIMLVKFSTTNISGTVSLDINSMGQVQVKKPSSSGLINLNPGDVIPNLVYNLAYDGTNFQLIRPYTNEDLFNVKYLIESTDYVLVPQNYQYWVYGDLEIQGELVNYGHVVIANGSMIINGGTFSNFGQFALVSLNSGSQSTYNDSDTIQFSVQNTILGPSVSSSVKHGGLTSSHLNTNTNGGATAGYFLSVDGNGYFQWLNTNISGISGVTAGIGLTGGGSGNQIQLDLDVGTNSGLTFSNNSLVLSIDNSTININNSGQIYASSSSIRPVYQKYITPVTSGDNQPTGLTLSYQPSNYFSFQVFVNGVLQNLGDGVSNTDCYFFNGSTVSLSNLNIGDELYWNGNIAGFDLNYDFITLIYGRP